MSHPPAIGRPPLPDDLNDARPGAGLPWLYWRLSCEPRRPPPAGREQGPRLQAMATLADELIATELPAWLAALQARGWLANHFFIRYAEGGYHLRLRLQASSATAAAEITEAIEQAVLGFVGRHGQHFGLDQAPSSAAALLATGLLHRSTYEPEVVKFGGWAGLGLAEQHFARSSEVSARVLAGERQYGRQRSLAALELIAILVASLAITPAEQADLLRGHTEYWLGQWGAPVRRPLLARLEVQYQQQRAGLERRWPGDGRGLLERDWPAEQNSPFPAWRAHLPAHLATYRALEAMGKATTPWLAPLTRPGAPAVSGLAGSSLVVRQIVPNYLHLLCNRLGVTVLQELQLTYLLSRWLESSADRPAIALPLQLEPPVASA